MWTREDKRGIREGEETGVGIIFSELYGAPHF